MIATLCSHLSGNPVQHGIKILDRFTKLCSNYRNGVLLASRKAFRWKSYFCYKQCKSSKFKSNDSVWVGSKGKCCCCFCGLQVFMREITF